MRSKVFKGVINSWNTLNECVMLRRRADEKYAISPSYILFTIASLFLIRHQLPSLRGLSLFISPLISFFLCVLFFSSLSLSLCRSDGSSWGCDPITGWLQQSQTADWFYNPHWGSQTGEKQLAKKCHSEGCHTDAHTQIHTETSTCAHQIKKWKCKRRKLTHVILSSLQMFSSMTPIYCFHSVHKSFLKRCADAWMCAFCVRG